jgi:sensor domain CHASE-containing protein/signal transduction histidine kinase
LELRRKTLLIFTVTLAGLLALVLVLSRMVILRSFSALEEEETGQHIERAANAYLEDLSSLDRTAKDYASWDAMYEYLAERNGIDAPSEFGDQTLANIRVNFVLIIDASGRIVLSRALDPQKGTSIPIPASFTQMGLRLARQGKLPALGPALLPQGVLLMSARPVLTSEDKGPTHGVFVMGRLLDSGELARLAEISHQTLQLSRLDGPVGKDVQTAIVTLAKRQPSLVRVRSRDSIAGYRLLEDLDGRAALVLRVDSPRHIYRQGEQTLITFTALLLLAGVVFAALILFLLEKAVLSRIATLSDQVRAVRSTGDLTTPVKVAGHDEIAELAAAIDGTFKELERNKTLLETVIADLPLPLLACDAAGHITHYNREAAKLLSMPSPEASAAATGAHPPDFEVYLPDGVTVVSPENRPLARVLRGEAVRHLELIVAPSGSSSTRTLLFSGRRLVGPKGQLLGAVAVAEDITERRRSELELERLHGQLHSAARQAGMAEVATNVLHNVGNVLNSVNVSAHLIRDRVLDSKALNLGKVVELLRLHEKDLASFITVDERGRHLLPHLDKLAEHIRAEQTSLVQEIESLRNNIEHIKDIVAMQQRYAKVSGVKEIVGVIDLIEDSVRLNAEALVRHNVEVFRDYRSRPLVNLDKHKVLQILVNLVRNAKYACEESGQAERRITLQVATDQGRVLISVIDNGVGIPPENLQRIFNHGFTTRASGHGFGLHSGALAAKELGGSLTAHSEGTGRGATFVLELAKHVGYQQPAFHTSDVALAKASRI